MAFPLTVLEPTTAIDPVCGMTVTLPSRISAHKHDRTEYHFCAELCRRRFAANPTKYLQVNEPAEMVGASTVRYICPMCPGVEKLGPGRCPKCGMALEPVDATATEADDPELTDFRKRFWWSLPFGLPLLVFGMFDMLWPGHPISKTIGQFLFDHLTALLCAPVLYFAGPPIFDRFLDSIRARSWNMFTLIGAGVLAALLFSLLALLDAYLRILRIDGLFSYDFRGMRSHVMPHFESVAGILLLTIGGQLMESLARQRTGAAVRELMKLTPGTANVLVNGEPTELPVEFLEPDDRILVPPGGAIPVDGVVEAGQADVNEAMLTGESRPVAKQPGAQVRAGTVNGLGVLTIRATHVGKETTLAKIAELVSTAQRTRLPVQRTVDAISLRFVPIVFIIAVLTFLFWLSVGQGSMAVMCGLSVLVIACPCALGLATPMAVVVAAGAAAKQGFLFRQAEQLERLSKITTVVFDKTGTLTVGVPSVIQAEISDNALSLATAVEAGSEHPLGKAMVSYAKSRNLSWPEATDVFAEPGQGIRGMVGRDVVRITTAMDALPDSKATVVQVFINDKPSGTLALADDLRTEAATVVKELQQQGYRTVLLSGDRAEVVDDVASRSGISEKYASQSPAQKFAEIDKLRAAGPVAMVGDGINDAPALAQADVGIALGTGTGAALGAAGVTLLQPNLTGVLRALTLGKRTLRIIRQNLFLAFAYNVLAIPIAAGVLVPFRGPTLTPSLAAGAMAFSSLAVILNSLRLRSR
jgi:P-type Cu+ transporter